MQQGGVHGEQLPVKSTVLALWRRSASLKKKRAAASRGPAATAAVLPLHVTTMHPSPGTAPRPQRDEPAEPCPLQSCFSTVFYLLLSLILFLLELSSAYGYLISFALW
jgi:hypothetical protein